MVSMISKVVSNQVDQRFDGAYPPGSSFFAGANFGVHVPAPADKDFLPLKW
jgi:hypothetical protein